MCRRRFSPLDRIRSIQDLSGIYTANLFDDLELYLGQLLSLYVAISLAQSLGQIFSFIEGQFLAQIKCQIVEQIGCVDAALQTASSKSL